MPERPIRDMLKKYTDSQPVRFHMPGHKGLLSRWDVTELDPTDDLNNPGPAINKAQQLLSLSYGSNNSYLLCGGATEGLKAMFRYLRLIGGSVIMPRNSHKNAFYACIENDIDSIVFDTVYDPESGVAAYEDLLIERMHAHPEAGAVFVTRPDYYGRCLNLQAVAEHARRMGMLLLCDSAHGAHFALSNKFPYDAAGYADIWVHSAHKTLGALTPSAFLHCSKNIDDKLMSCILPSVRTSSPNYEIIMSMDDCRSENFEKPQVWEKRLREIEKMTVELDKIPGIKVLGKPWAQCAGYQDKDPTRLVIDCWGLGGGFHAKKQLEEQNIFVEMADARNITAIATPFDKREWDDMLVDAIANIQPSRAQQTDIAQPETLIRALSMREAYYTGKRFIGLGSAQGCVSAEVVGIYPPGTPVILPGEVFSKSVIEYLARISRCGGSLFGAPEGVRII